MTVTYTHEVATSTGFGCFWKLLFRWRGSIYKLVWPDLTIYTVIYYSLRFLYQFGLEEEGKRVFEQVAIYCQQFTDLIPVSFVLGFYVSIVVQRWWAQYSSIPWPDSLGTLVSTSLHGQDERSRLMRRTVIRYANLSIVLTLIMISPRAKKRFPTMDHLVEAGFMTENEKKIFDNLDEITSHPKYWMPLVWAGTIIARARKEGRIRDDYAVNNILNSINTFRGLCGGLLNYDWISIPLVYTQVVTLSVYSFFFGTLFGRQFLKVHDQIGDLYVPWFTFLQFFFYMGWLKVAETLVNPFGEDDDDFEVNWLIDRNLQVSYLIVDEMHSEHPELIQDKYWDEVFPQELPYTVAAEQYRTEPPQGSTAFMEVPEEDQEFLPLIEDDYGNDDVAVSMESADSRNSRCTDIKGNRVPTAQSNLSGFGSHQSSILSRRPSMLSVLLNKFKKSHSKRSIRKGSRSSLYERHNRKASSRRSSGSHSPSSLQRNTSQSLKDDSDIFHMSSDSRIETRNNTVPGRLVSLPSEDDEHIYFKIKKRAEKDEHTSSPYANFTQGNQSDSSMTLLLPDDKDEKEASFKLAIDLSSDKKLSEATAVENPIVSSHSTLGRKASTRHIQYLNPSRSKESIQRTDSLPLHSILKRNF